MVLSQTSSSTLVLLHAPGSLRAWTVKLALGFKGLPYRVAVRSEWPEERLMLEDGWVRLFTVSTSVLYIERRKPEPILLSRDLRRRARALQVLSRVEGAPFAASPVAAERVPPQDAAENELFSVERSVRDEAESFLRQLEQDLEGDLAGEPFGLVDFSFLPLVHGALRTLSRTSGETGPATQRWLQRLAQLPYYATATTEGATP